MRPYVLCLALLPGMVMPAHADDTATAAATTTATAPGPAQDNPTGGAAAPVADPAAATAATPATDNGAREPASPTRIYLVARIKLNGTDLTQVIFFQSDAITSLDDCEAERNAGMTTGWIHYRVRYLNTPPGVSYKIDYRCVQSDQHLNYWHRSNPMSSVYLVHTEDARLGLQPYDNFFHCRDALRSQIGRKKEETIDVFCATSSQSVLKDTDQDVMDDESPANTDAAPSPAH